MTYNLVLTFAPSMTGEWFCINLRSINDAMTNILSMKLNALNSRRNFSHGKLIDCVEAGGVYQISYGRVAKLMHPLLNPTLKNRSPNGRNRSGQ